MGGLSLLPLLVAGAALAGTGMIQVAPGDLSTALAASGPGDTLVLQSGVHPGPLVVDRRVHLRGERGAIVQGSGEGTPLVLAADGITLEGITVRGAGADLSRDDAVILLREVRGVTIQGCRVEARAFGIYLRAGGGHHIVDNEIVGAASLALSRRGNGIHLWNTTDNEIRDNLLSDVRDGIYLSFAHDNRIVGNEGTELRYGIHYMYSEHNVLRGNKFHGCTGGIALMFSMRNRIEENDTTGNRDFGILCQQLENSRLIANVSERNGRGIYMENSVGNRFEGNVVRENGVGIFLTAGSERNVFTANRFERNLVQVRQDRRGRNAWTDAGHGNVWSDYTGFDWNGDGVGDTPYRLNTAASTLLAHRPATRWFWMSSMLVLLDWWDARLSEPETAIFDAHPLLAAPRVLR